VDAQIPLGDSLTSHGQLSVSQSTRQVTQRQPITNI